MLDTDTIHTCDLRHPQQNLRPAEKGFEEPEAEFADHFAAVYKSAFPKVHAKTTRRRTLFVRELPVSGSGIADLVVLNWSGRNAPRDDEDVDLPRFSPTVRAFEVKLKNWRGGLMQAHRYSYFSHAAMLVVPITSLATIRNHLNLFKTLRVGLWGFDRGAERIAPLYTPRPRRQQVPKLAARALTAAIGIASA